MERTSTSLIFLIISGTISLFCLAEILEIINVVELPENASFMNSLFNTAGIFSFIGLVFGIISRNRRFKALAIVGNGFILLVYVLVWIYLYSEMPLANN